MAVSGPLKVAAREAAEQREARKLAAEPDQIRVRHILVMHDDSKSRPDDLSRSRKLAQARAEECLEKLRSGADFVEMVEEYSDEPGAADQGGAVGPFGRGEMVRSFTDTAFDLKIGEISEVVETPYGFHIIKRTE